MLLEPFEEQLNQPSFRIKIGAIPYSMLLVFGNELSINFFILVSNESKLPVVFFSKR